MTGKAGAPLTEAMFYVLMALRRGELCGTEIAAWTERCTEGRVRLGPGTLYGALSQLTERGWIEVYSQQTTSRKKKEYVITPQGREAFAKEVERLEEMLRNSALMEEDAQ